MSYRRFTSVLVLAVLFFGATSAQAEIADGYGYYVRPSQPIELGNNPAQWLYFAPFQAPPKPPSQSDIVLTPDDPLTVLVPQFAHMPLMGTFGTGWTRDGDTIQLNAYFGFTGGATETIYGPHAYRFPIGQLPAGTYHLTANYFRWGRDLAWDPALATEFLNDPAGFAAAHDIPIDHYEPVFTFPDEPLPPFPIEAMPPSLDLPIDTGDYGQVLQTSLTFTIVPEPASAVILIAGTLTLACRRRARL